MTARPVGLRLVISAAAALAALVMLGHHAHAATHRAGLVIQHASGALLTRCISFAEEKISGIALTERSGISYQTQGFGDLGMAICQLDGEPSPVPSGCFGSGPYWQYFHGGAGGWTPSSLGASSWMLKHGDMDGWRFASGSGKAPAPLTFEQVCAPAPSAPPSVVQAPTPASSAPPSPAASAAPLKTGPTVSPSDLTVAEPQATPSAIPDVSPRPSPTSTVRVAMEVLGGSLTLLIGLAAWNFFRHAP